MRTIQCSNCGAPLQIQAGAEIVGCRYCGTSNQLTSVQARLRLGLAGIRAGERAAVLGCLSVTLLSLFTVGGVAIAVIGLSRDHASAPIVISVPPLPSPPGAPRTPGAPPIPRLTELTELAERLAPARSGKASVGPSELGSIGGRGWVPVQTPPPTGSLAAFDPVANLPWALGMARAWSTDARIESIYMDGVRADGGLDLSSRDDWDVDYRFFSPALRASARSMAAVSEATVQSELRLRVVQGGVVALLSEAHGLKNADPPEYSAPCAFPEVMRRAVAGGLEPRPAYGVILQNIGARGWRWVVSGQGANSVMVPVGACTGA